MTSERWLPVVGFLGYEVSDLGNVRSWRTNSGARSCVPRTMQQHIKKGYATVLLTRDRKKHYPLVHRLVLEAFVGSCPSGMEACHAPDATRTNCRLDNLRWDTKAANIQDREDMGNTARGDRSGARIHKLNRGEENGRAVLCAAGVKLLRYLHVVHKVRPRDLGRWFGVTPEAAGMAARFKTWRELPQQEAV